eukprot:scaffold18754_cov155-Skeletonema_dohrnii-CCMP3373.AAC.5
MKAYLLFWIVELRGQSGSGVAEPIQYQSGCEALFELFHASTDGSNAAVVCNVVAETVMQRLDETHKGSNS